MGSRYFLQTGLAMRPSNIVKRAHGLFIYAATVCHLIKRNEEWPLQELLNLFILNNSANDPLKRKRSEITHNSPTWELDNMYLQTLRRSFVRLHDERDKPRLLRRFKQVIGSIVVLFHPLTSVALAKLLNMLMEGIYAVLKHMPSILDISDFSDSLIRLLHPSFFDFLLDPQRCLDPQFRIDERKTHNDLSSSCLELMSNHLKRDMCNLGMLGALSSEVGNNMVEHCLPLEIQYACLYWVYHLRQCPLPLPHRFVQGP
jgi:hypothetical protein